jgi:recombination protein RecT
MGSQQIAVIHESLHGSESKSLASRFNSGRFDKDMKWAAERSFALQAINKNEQLQRCSTESIQSAMLDVAYSGLTLAPSLAHGYLIPYGNTCTFSPGYRGLMHMGFKAGTVKSIQVNLACRNDTIFRVWTDERGRHLQHEENMGKRGEVTHAYCICNLTAGGPPIIEVMGRADLDAVRSASKDKRTGSVWNIWPAEMMKKAVIRRASKFWPKDNGGLIQHMMEVSDRHDVEFSPSPDETPSEAELCMTDDMNTELNDVLVNRGISATAAPEWLRRWAQSKGYASISDTPGRLFEEAKKTLIERLDERDQSTPAGSNAPDNQ